jgi:hypothetical protein
MTDEQFNALMALIDAMIDDKIIGDNHTSYRKMLLEKDARALFVEAARAALEKKDD